MLIHSLRKRMKGVIWFIVITFVLSIFFLGAASYFDSQRAGQQRTESEHVRSTQVNRDLELFRSPTPLAEVSLGGNSSVITEGLLNRRMVEAGMSPDKLQDIPEFYREALRSNMVEQLISEELMFLEGQSQRLDVEAAVLSQIESIRQRQGGGEMFSRLLQSNGFSDEDDFRDYLRRGLVMQKLREKLFARRTVTDDDIRLYYSAQPDSFKDEQGNRKPLEEVKNLIHSILQDQVTEEELQAYYEQHKPRWQKPKVIDLRYMVLNVESRRFPLAADAIEEMAVQTYYDTHHDDFLAPEKVGLELLYLDKDKLRQTFVLVDEELEQYYRDNELRYYEEARVNAAHILVSADTQGSDEQALNFIENLKADILTKKIEFAEAAKLYSEDGGSGSQGGSLGVFYRGEMEAAFDEYCFEGPVKALSEPIKTVYGYHLIFVEERFEARQKPLSEVYDEVASAVIEDGIGLVADDVLDTILLQKQSMSAEIHQERQKMLTERRAKYPESINRSLLSFAPLHEQISGLDNPSFGQYAKVFSQALSAEKDGFIGKVLLGEGNDPEVIKEIAVGTNGDRIDYSILSMLRTIKTGEISDMVETPRGYYLLRITDRDKQELRPLEEVREKIEKILMAQKRQELYQRRIASIYEELGKGRPFGELTSVNSDSKTAAQGGLVENLPLDMESSPIGYADGVREDLFTMGKIDEKIFSILQYLPANKVSQPLNMGDRTLFFYIEQIHPLEFASFSKVQAEIKDIMIMKINESEIKEFYNRNLGDYMVKPRIVLQQLLYRDEETAKSQLQAIKKGLSFEKAGESHINLDRGNFVTNRGRVELENLDFLDMATRAKVYALDAGGILDEPVKLQIGYSLIKLVEKTEQRVKELTEVADTIVQKLREQKRDKIFESYLKELKNKATNIKML